MVAILKDKDKALIDNLGEKKESITISPDIVVSLVTFWLGAFLAGIRMRF